MASGGNTNNRGRSQVPRSRTAAAKGRTSSPAAAKRARARQASSADARRRQAAPKAKTASKPKAAGAKASPKASGKAPSKAKSQAARAGSHASQHSRTKGHYEALGRDPSWKKESALAPVGRWIMSSKAALAVVAVVAVLLVGGAVDALANLNKAYGNVTVNGMSVAGMNADEMQRALASEFGQRVSRATPKVYASEQARADEAAREALPEEERLALAEHVSVEEADAAVTSWTTSAQDLRASIAYEDVVQQALAAGREGGPLSRLGLFFSPVDIALGVQFDDQALDAFASGIDRAIGDARIDATVAIEYGEAFPVEGHDGQMVDREWLAGKLSDAMMLEGGQAEIIAEASFAPSRISAEQAQAMADAVNQALRTGANFTYQGKSWTADSYELGDWTSIAVAEADSGGYELRATVNAGPATAALVKNVDATVMSGDVNVTFEKSGDDFVVRTSGTGNIPEVGSAIDRLDEALYGAGGTAWATFPSTPSIAIGESDAPEELTFDQALQLGVVTVIGEYTTEYSNYEGTENRNHNIRLAADLINDTVTTANGGTWSFNDHSGDTNQDPPFASAGSIVNGEYVDSIGGGICQVATTVFNAVYEAGLDVDRRWNHSFYIASYPTGRDATVSYPDLDFVWSNPLQSDVLLKMSYTDTTLTARLYSVYTGWYAETQTGDWEEGEKYELRFEHDDDLADDYYYLKTYGEDGSSIEVTRTVYDKDGNVLNTRLFSSVYTPKDEVYVVGPKVDTAKLEKELKGEEDKDGTADA